MKAVVALLVLSAFSLPAFAVDAIEGEFDCLFQDKGYDVSVHLTASLLKVVDTGVVWRKIGAERTDIETDKDSTLFEYKFEGKTLTAIGYIQKQPVNVFTLTHKIQKTWVLHGRALSTRGFATPRRGVECQEWENKDGKAGAGQSQTPPSPAPATEPKK